MISFGLGDHLLVSGSAGVDEAEVVVMCTLDQLPDLVPNPEDGGWLSGGPAKEALAEAGVDLVVGLKHRLQAPRPLFFFAFHCGGAGIDEWRDVRANPLALMLWSRGDGDAAPS